MPISVVSRPRIKVGETIILQYISYVAVRFFALARVVYDDGTDDYLQVSGTTGALGNIETLALRGKAVQDGVVANFVISDVTGNTANVIRGTAFFQAFIAADVLGSARTDIASDYLYVENNPTLGGGFPYEGGPFDILADSGQVAGNAIAISSVGLPNSVLGRATVEIGGLIYSYKCDATVVTRTTAAPTMSAPNDSYATGFGTSTAGYTGSTLSLTASQDGQVQLEVGGTELKNQNGTVTFATSKLWLPWKAKMVTALTFSVAAATAGVAGDVHRVIVVGRYVA